VQSRPAHGARAGVPCVVTGNPDIAERLAIRRIHPALGPKTVGAKRLAIDVRKQLVRTAPPSYSQQ
jgi:hypothetical protein